MAYAAGDAARTKDITMDKKNIDEDIQKLLPTQGENSEEMADALNESFKDTQEKHLLEEEKYALDEEESEKLRDYEQEMTEKERKNLQPANSDIPLAK
jgi:beta-glucosidase-like glycosyl hydrolase